MKIDLKCALKCVGLIVCLAIFTHGGPAPNVMDPQLRKPITKANLISSLELGRAEGMTAERYVELINSAGVAFSLTAKDEQRIRAVGRYLGKAGLDSLVAAIRNNYRPTERAARDEPRTTGAPAAAEPTEAEMKEALERTVRRRGGRLRPDGSMGV